MVCECEDRERNYYRYYDTPDGCDVLKKVGVTTRYGVITGMVIATYDVMMYSHDVGFGPILRRCMKHTIPLGLIGATFALVANNVQHLRKKDDIYNYFAGGLACGPIVGTYLRNNHLILIGGLALGVVGMVKKNAIINGYTFFPETVPMWGTINSWRNDFTLVEDPRTQMIADCKNQGRCSKK